MREAVPSIASVRAVRRAPYPDAAVHLEVACAAYGVPFARLDGDGGTVVRIGAPPHACVVATTGRTCVYPLNTATAMALATDKHFTRIALDAAGVANLGGESFFLDARRAGQRRPGREVDDARRCFDDRGGVAFCKPLAGSRGDFAERIAGRAAFEDWLVRVAAAHDAVLLQDVFEGDEFRVFVVDDATVFVMQRFAPVLRGDGTRTLGALHSELTARQTADAISASVLPRVARTNAGRAVTLDDVLSAGETVALDDRRNASAGATVRLVAVDDAPDGVVALAHAARRATGLRVAGVDVMVCADGPRIIEVNGNPAIASLETLGRDDLVLRVWGEVFERMGLVDGV